MKTGQDSRTLAAPIAMFLPYGFAFLASFCMMLVELVAGRLLSRSVGASLYSWTSIIGVILGGMTIGNLLGGRLADRFPARRLAGVIFCLAGGLCLIIPLLELEVTTWPIIDSVGRSSWPARVLAQVFAVFLLPAVALGLLGPIVAKWAIDQGRSTGRTVGNVYAWGALGSIVGTFFTGFYLIAAIGSAGSMYTAGILLVVGGVVLSPFTVLPVVLLAWPLVGSCVLTHYRATHGRHREWVWAQGRPVLRQRDSPGRVYVDESQYSLIKVLEEKGTGELNLCLDNLVHSQYHPGQIRRLVYAYEKIYASITQRTAKGRSGVSALFLGGGGYIFPRYVQSLWPQSLIQVAEIDPAVTEACFEAFDLRREQVRIRDRLSLSGRDKGALDGVSAPLGDNSTSGERLGPSSQKDVPSRPIDVFHMDARNHVEDLIRQKGQSPEFEPFDFVYGDAFNDYSVPFHLVTREFTAKIRELLRPATGLYLLNVIDIFASGHFLGAILNTLRTEFPRVYVFSTVPNGPDLRPKGRDTFIVVGALQDLDLSELGLREGETPFEGTMLSPEHVEILRQRSRGVVLTDDYSPVENLLEEVVRRRIMD